ncbi:DUF4352 domain-containing protein [Streptomonospora salina]|uniref:DUF4352 domain-containing protein n=1 Tax=Streptomonospora salina TaxID=104205 RepID=A0A841EA36_9ACTN|nr:DUF4352 domain-containing protein [Streptomonospora salina]MBB5999862.1 hypothetical protein [Streptomonospora salina]
MSYGDHPPPPPPPVPPNPPRRDGLTTGSKIGLGCGIAAAVGFMLLFGGCMAVIVAAPGGDTVESTDPPQAGSGSGSGSDRQDTQEQQEDQEDTPAGIGDTVESGAFAFTVTGVETGVAEVSDDSGYITETPDGRYVVVAVTVENIGDESGYFDSSSQTLVDVDDKQYSTDTAAEITGGAESFLNEINPGNEVEGELVFDVPAGVELDRLELRDFVSFDESAVVDVSGER